MVRDGALHAAGLLCFERGGPPVYPYQPLGLWLEKSGRRYPTSRGDGLHRRSLYTFWKRTSPPPTLSMFDAPAREVCTVARPATTTPLQTLALWNDPQFVEVAVVLGARALAATDSDIERVGYLMRALTSRMPSAEEERALVELLAEQRAAYRADPAQARELAGFDLERLAHPPQQIRVDAWAGPRTDPEPIQAPIQEPIQEPVSMLMSSPRVRPRSTRPRPSSVRRPRSSPAPCSAWTRA